MSNNLTLASHCINIRLKICSKLVSDRNKTSFSLLSIVILVDLLLFTSITVLATIFQNMLLSEKYSVR